MTKEDIKYIEDYLEWVRQNMNPAEVDFEHFANGMMNCNNILSQALSLHNIRQQRELFDAILDFTEDLPMCSEDYNRDTLYKRYIAENCG